MRYCVDCLHLKLSTFSGTKYTYMHIQYYYLYYLFCGTVRKRRNGTESSCGNNEGDEFLLATISAPGFPLVYPEVNNWCEDKSVCEGEWDIQTRGWKPGQSPLYHAPLSARVWPLVVQWPFTPPPRTIAWSANLCSDLFLVAVSMFSSCQWRLTGGSSHPCAGTVAGSLTGQWHCPTR